MPDDFSSDHHEYAGGLARITLAGVMWGTISVFVRMVAAHPAVIVFWRVAFAGLAVAAGLAVRGRLREVFSLPRRRMMALAVMGALLAVNWVLFLGALQLTKVSIAVLLGYLGPVIVASLGPLFTGQPFDRRVLLPLLLSLAGTIVIVGPNDLALERGSQLLGAGMAFASAFTYAVLVLNAKRLLQGIPATVYMLGEDLVAAIVLLPAVVFLHGPSRPVEWGALLVLGVIDTAVAGWIFLSGLRRVRADHAAILTYAEPLSAVVCAAIFLGEPLTWATALGGALIIIGGVIVARMSPSPAPGEPVLLEAEDRDTAGRTAP